MIELREGDSLPVVATCQVLLNAYRLISTRIAIDGISAGTPGTPPRSCSSKTS